MLTLDIQAEGRFLIELIGRFYRDRFLSLAWSPRQVPGGLLLDRTGWFEPDGTLLDILTVDVDYPRVLRAEWQPI